MTDSMERTAEFYGKLFGWQFLDTGPEMGHYNMVFKDGQPVGGAMGNADAAAGMPEEMKDQALGNYWSVYLDTPDIQALVARATAKGAKVEFEPMQISTMGLNTMLEHTSVGHIGFWQPLDFAGIGQMFTPGTPYWFELHTREFDAALEFLREVAQWDVTMLSDTPPFRYAQQHEGGAARAGVYDSTPDTVEGTPAAWAIYFGVEDIDATLEKLVGLGGIVERAAEDTPFGRLANAVDPLGARFRLAQPVARVGV